jgi:cytidylate kinase
MKVITISKESATDSEKVAALVAKRLGWEYIGKRLVAEIAKELRISESDVEMFRQASQSRILKFVDRYTCSLVQKVVDREYGCLDDKAYFDITKKLVENLYEVGSVVILGWGGQCLLRGKPDVFHVRLRKDEEAKIAAVMERYHLDRQAAKRFIETEEGDSRSYVRHYFQEDWNDARLYDLIIDMGRNSAEQAAEKICDNVVGKIC